MANDKLLKQIYKNLRTSGSAYKNLFKDIKEDFKFVQGEQWDKEDIITLKNRGIKALTINKIRPIIKLITGIERQSKSDFIAFPEGGEDTLVADIATRLLKNASKSSNAERKLSSQFKSGAIGGLSFLEPYLDFTHSIINGELKFSCISAYDIYLDPDGVEYDLSDHKYVIKVTRDLCKEDLELLFPDDSAKLNKITSGKFIDTMFETDGTEQALDYPNPEEEQDNYFNGSDNEAKYDLVDYYYKKNKRVYYVADPQRGILKESESKEQAEQVAQQVETAQVISKVVPEIRHAQVVGNQVMFDDTVWSYPKYKKYPIFPFFAEYIPENIGDKTLNIQGIVRSIKDLNMEFNKRRTQELNHLNSSVNSGLFVPKGSLSPADLEKAKKLGSAPGVVIEYDPVKGAPEKQFPTPLSQGHAQLAEENSQDLKEASGVNPDLLANSSQSQSGRAILLKQRQGLVMIQEMLDNFSGTKKLIAQFILSQFKEIYTVDTAMKVVGDSFIQEAFTVPVTSIIQRGLDKIKQGGQPSELEYGYMLQYPQGGAAQPVMDEQGQMVMVVDLDSAIELVNKVLNDGEIGKYDVSVGEGPFNETVRISNFGSLVELAQQGVDIPPSVLIDMSLIPDNEKKKIQTQIQAQQQAMAQQGQAQMQQEDKHHSEEMKVKQGELEVKQFLARVKAYEADMNAKLGAADLIVKKETKESKNES